MIRSYFFRRAVILAFTALTASSTYWCTVSFGQTPVDLVVQKAVADKPVVSDEFWPTRDDILRRLERNESELSRSEVQLRATELGQDTAWLIESIKTQIAQRQFLKTVYQQHLSLLDAIAASDVTNDELEKELESFNDRQIAVSEMLSFGEVERLKAVFDNEGNRIATIQAEID